MDTSLFLAIVDRPSHAYLFTDLNSIWFVLVGVLFTGYAILDGFDLGVGILHPFVKGDKNRRILLNSIGPVWDGNEVWLVTGGGALFAAFPIVYAAVFSGFYMAFMLLLIALIMRAVSIEFRSKIPSKAWSATWDWCFAIGSFLIALLIGVAMGNIAWGVPLNAQGDYTGGFFDLLHPYALLQRFKVLPSAASWPLRYAMFSSMSPRLSLPRTSSNVSRPFQHGSSSWRPISCWCGIYRGNSQRGVPSVPSSLPHFPWSCSWCCSL